MRPQLIMFFAFVTLVSNLLCGFMDGLWLQPADLNLMNYMTGYNSWTEGFLPVVAPVIGFFTHGLPKLIFWDFSFLDGGLSFIRWILMAFSIGAIFGIVMVIRGNR